jgi:hypothetical protein
MVRTLMNPPDVNPADVSLIEEEGFEIEDKEAQEAVDFAAAYATEPSFRNPGTVKKIFGILGAAGVALFLTTLNRNGVDTSNL